MRGRDYAFDRQMQQLEAKHEGFVECEEKRYKEECRQLIERYAREHDNVRYGDIISDRANTICVRQKEVFYDEFCSVPCMKYIGERVIVGKRHRSTDEYHFVLQKNIINHE